MKNERHKRSIFQNNQQSSQTIGNRGEEYAAAYLAQQGYAIVKRNYKIRGGEIDLVARKGDEIVFVEVKTRTRTTYGYPEQGVTPAKARFLERAIREFTRKYKVSEEFYIRFDIVAVEWSESGRNPVIRHIQNVELPTWGRR